MQILPISVKRNKMEKSPSFGDCAIRDCGEKLATHFSYIGRELCISRPMINRTAIDMLAYDNGCEFLFCGCSDGSEVLDIYMSLLYFFFENKIPFEYFPKFKAFDSSPQMVDIAKNGRINISSAGMNYIKTCYPKFNFFRDESDVIYHEGDNIQELERKIGSTVEHSYQFQPKLLEKIEFYVGNMLQEFSKIKSNVCKILFCRNVARYNSEEDQIKAAQLLDNNLKKGSLVVIGYNDEHNVTDKDNNIIESMVNNINSCPRLPFAETLYSGNFVQDKTISGEGLVYKKY